MITSMHNTAQNSRITFKSKVPNKLSIAEAVEKYISNPTQKNKTTAFETIDVSLQKQAKKVASKNEGCSYEDYLQNLRLYFLEKLEEGKNGEKTTKQVISTVNNHRVAEDDIFFGKGHPFMDLINVDKACAEDETIVSNENNNVYSAFINPLLKKLPENDRKLINARFGLYDDYPVKRNYEMGIAERSKFFKYSRDTLCLLKEKAIRKIRCILDEKPDIKTLLTDTLLKDTESVYHPDKI